ncbi:MAG: ECF-type sigma factor [Phycisphaerales bacterium]
MSNERPDPGVTLDDRSALDELFASHYEDLRTIAAHVLGHDQSIKSLNPTRLVHDAYLRIADRAEHCPDRLLFLPWAAKVMRNILVDHARRRHALKGPGGRVHVELTSSNEPTDRLCIDVLELDDALNRLRLLKPTGERMVAGVELRFFGGVSLEDTAKLLGVCDTTIKQDWRIASAWCLAELK